MPLVRTAALTGLASSGRLSLRSSASGKSGRRSATAAAGRAWSESLEQRQLLTINASVVVGGTLDINPISSVFSSSTYTILTVNYTAVPGTAHGTIGKYDGVSEYAWGTGAPNSFGPTATYGSTANRIFAGQGLRYHNDGTGQGSTESIPVTIRDSTGFNAYNDTIVISIVSPVGAPKITTQPIGLTSVPIGQHATLSVAATGNATLTYQWYTGLSPNTSAPIAGATAATYNTPTLSDSGQHFYWVQVKNSVGVANSDTATVKSGHPPVVSAVGPFTVAENGSVVLTGAAATDPDNGLFLVYDWDLDGDGIYGEANTANGNESVKAPTLLAGGHDGPGSFNVSLRVTNDNGVSGYATATINVTNSPPVATFAGTSVGNVVSFTNPVDSTLDVASLKYSYDFDDNGTFDVVNSTLASASVPGAFLAGFLAGQPVRGRVIDKDGASTDYVASIHGRAILVTTLADESNSTANYAITAGTSLREAVALAQADATTDNIVFDPSLFLAGTGNINLTLAGSSTNGPSAFGITTPTFITGPAVNSTLGVSIRGQGTAVNYRAFYVANTGSLTLENLTLRDFGSRAVVAQGGAIYNNGGTVAIIRSTLTANVAGNTGASGTAAGGAIYSTGGGVTITNSTVSGNVAGATGGLAAQGGGVYVRNGSLAIVSSTISANTATDGRGVFLFGDGANANASIINSILGQADAAVHDFAVGVANGGSTTSSGINNLIRNAVGFSGTSSTADPLLGTLALNGGTAPTIPILPNSPAINAAAGNAVVTVDERGTARPQGALPDIGAYERVASPMVATATAWEFQTRQAMTVSFTADESAVFSRGSYTIKNLTTAQTVAGSVGTFAFAADGKSATLNLTNLLADGRYRVTFTGVSGATTLDFFVLAGDTNHDGTVNFADLLTLAKNYGTIGKTFAAGDSNYDGTVDFNDLLMLAKGYGKTLPAAAPAMLPAAQATATSARKRLVDVIQ